MEGPLRPIGWDTMKRYKILYVGCLALALTSFKNGIGSAQEQQSRNSPVQTGNDLLRVCQSDNLFDRGVCGGFITAVSQMAQIADQACYFEDVTLEQGKDVVVRYLSSNPETRHKRAVVLTSKALIQAFPCKATPKE
jgi:hypothetical protein